MVQLTASEHGMTAVQSCCQYTRNIHRNSRKSKPNPKMKCLHLEICIINELSRKYQGDVVIVLEPQQSIAGVNTGQTISVEV